MPIRIHPRCSRLLSEPAVNPQPSPSLRSQVRILTAGLVTLLYLWGLLGLSQAQSLTDPLPRPPEVGPSIDTADLVEADFPLDPAITLTEIEGLENLEVDLGREIVVEPIPAAPDGIPAVPVVFIERSSGTTYRITPERGLEIVRPLTETEIQAREQQTRAAVDRTSGAETLLYPLPISVPVTSGFGLRVHPVSGEQEFHQGVDLGAPEGMPILAAFSGEIVAAGPMGGLGNAVSLANSSDQRTRYGHMSAIAATVGQKVKQGDVIGYVGATGLATGPHLHFELWQRTDSGTWAALDSLEDLTIALASLNT